MIITVRPGAAADPLGKVCPFAMPAPPPQPRTRAAHTISTLLAVILISCKHTDPDCD
jgi:hypothetical protein